MNSKVLEEGEIFFFYRPKIDAEKVAGVSDVQRFYFLLWPNRKKKGRLFVVGKKQLPDIVEGSSDSTERDWLMLDMVDSPDAIREALGPFSYDTKTEGEREQPQAVPTGEGRYALFERKGSTRLGYDLKRPEKRGNAQVELGIREQATYVFSIRNPEISVPGFPGAQPDFPPSLKRKFADKRFIDIDDPRLLDYPGAQFVLIGAHDSLDQADLQLDGKADVFKRLQLKRSEWQSDALESGNFAAPAVMAAVVDLTNERNEGESRGGKEATKTASAAGIAHALQDVHFPLPRPSLVKHAKENHAPEEIIDVLEELPNRKFESMADVEGAVGEMR